MLKIAFPRLYIPKFSGGTCPQTPLEARAFGVRFCDDQLKNSIFFAPPPPPSNYTPPSLILTPTKPNKCNSKPDRLMPVKVVLMFLHLYRNSKYFMLKQLDKSKLATRQLSQYDGVFIALRRTPQDIIRTLVGLTLQLVHRFGKLLKKVEHN